MHSQTHTSVPKNTQICGNLCPTELWEGRDMGGGPNPTSTAQPQALQLGWMLQSTELGIDFVPPPLHQALGESRGNITKFYS